MDRKNLILMAYNFCITAIRYLQLLLYSHCFIVIYCLSDRNPNKYSFSGIKPKNWNSFSWHAR